MGTFQEINLSFLNAFFSEKKYNFEKVEFERGLGIVDDSFYITLKSGDTLAIIRIITNLRCFKNGFTVLRYHDLFIDKFGKKMSKKAYRSQKEIENSALDLDLDFVNRAFNGINIKRINFSSNGDLKISMMSKTLISACDDLDICKNGRHLYEILILDTFRPTVFVVYENKKMIKVSKTTDVTIFQEEDENRIRFLI